MEITENNGDGTSSVVEIEFNDEGDELSRKIIDMYDNETGTSLIYNQETKHWEYPKSYFKEEEDETN